MERFIAYIRDNFRDVFDVKEPDDLPLILLTEVINQSVLRGATKVSVSYDGNVLCVKDNAKPFEDSLRSEVYIRPVGMRDPGQQRYFRIMDRQWGKDTLATVNALCSEFTLISSEGDRMNSVVCKDGLIVSENEGKIGIGDGNMVIMRAFRCAELLESEAVAELLDYMEYRLPCVKIQYKTKL